MNLFHDIKAAVKFTGQMRKARKSGASGIQMRPVWTMPQVRFGVWGFTMEGCLLGPHVPRETRRAAIAAFNGLPDTTQHALTFTPEAPGEWIQRAKFWHDLLRPVLPPKEFHHIVGMFAHHYAHCLMRRKAVSAVPQPQ